MNVSIVVKMYYVRCKTMMNTYFIAVRGVRKGLDDRGIRVRREPLSQEMVVTGTGEE